MVQLLWGILNIAAFIWFVSFCIKKTVEIRNKIGPFVAVVFAFFALSFIGKSNKDVDDKKFEFQKTNQKHNANRDSFFSEITLEDDLTTKIELGLTGDNESVHRAFVSRSGFVSGTDWKTDYITINKTEKKNIYRYHVIATRKWKILGIEIYTEGKNYEGIKEVKPL